MLGENIKHFRTKLGLTQEQLARKADVTYSSLSKIEVGYNDNPRVKTLRKIAVALEVTLDDLMNGVP